MDALFGTDGIRGTTEFTDEHRSRKLTPELALRIGQAVGCALTPTSVLPPPLPQVGEEGGRGKGVRVALIGRDPRISGMMLESALTAGLLSGAGRPSRRGDPHARGGLPYPSPPG